MTTAEWSAMVTMYQQGSTAKEVAFRFQVSESALLTRLRAEGLVRPNAKVTPPQVVEMAKLRQQGWTLQAIADCFGVTRGAVSARLRGWSDTHHSTERQHPTAE